MSLHPNQRQHQGNQVDLINSLPNSQQCNITKMMIGTKE